MNNPFKKKQMNVYSKKIKVRKLASTRQKEWENAGDNLGYKNNLKVTKDKSRDQVICLKYFAPQGMNLTGQNR